MTKTPLEVIQEGQKTLNGEFSRWQGDIVWHNANILALLQSLRAEEKSYIYDKKLITDYECGHNQGIRNSIARIDKLMSRIAKG